MRKTTREPLNVRIRRHYTPGIDYHELMRLVFPLGQYPRAFNYSSNGGPPGCAMAFGRGLRQMGATRTDGRVWLPNRHKRGA